eukprot:1530307-Amphidinium_carterae.2
MLGLPARALSVEARNEATARSDELAQTRQQLDEAAQHIDELRDAAKQQEEHLRAAVADAKQESGVADAVLQEKLDAAKEELQQ